MWGSGHQHMPTALRATLRAVCGMTGFHRHDEGARPVLAPPPHHPHATPCSPGTSPVPSGSAVIRRYDTGPPRPTEVAPLNRNSG